MEVGEEADTKTVLLRQWLVSYQSQGMVMIHWLPELMERPLHLPFTTPIPQDMDYWNIVLEI